MKYILALLLTLSVLNATDIKVGQVIIIQQGNYACVNKILYGDRYGVLFNSKTDKPFHCKLSDWSKNITTLVITK